MRLFPLPPEQRGAAQSWLEDPERSPRRPRLASSVVLVRDSPQGPQTYLAYRPGESPLGRVAFPGGSLEADDDADVAWYGPDPARWAQSLDLPDASLARRHVAAAIRELFEETGLLLAGPDPSALLESNAGPEWMPARQAVASGDAQFLGMLERRGLGLRTDLLRPLSHWQSPEFALRRFDTRYFAAVAPLGQEPTLLEGKGVWGRWVVAADVVAEAETTALGDEIGRPETVGRTLAELTVPAVALMLEKIAASRSCIAYLSRRRTPAALRPDLVQADGQLLLAVRPGTPEEYGARREL